MISCSSHVSPTVWTNSELVTSTSCKTLIYFFSGYSILIQCQLFSWPGGNLELLAEYWRRKRLSLATAFPHRSLLYLNMKSSRNNSYFWSFILILPRPLQLWLEIIFIAQSAQAQNYDYVIVSTQKLPHATMQNQIWRERKLDREGRNFQKCKTDSYFLPYFLKIIY